VNGPRTPSRTPGRRMLPLQLMGVAGGGIAAGVLFAVINQEWLMAAVCFAICVPVFFLAWRAANR
jgi:hypothetical protein